MGIGGEEEEAECIRAELLLFYFLARSHSLRHLPCAQESRAAGFPDKPGVAVRLIYSAISSKWLTGSFLFLPGIFSTSVQSLRPVDWKCFTIFCLNASDL